MEMEVDEILMNAEERMEKALDAFGNAFGSVRTGRANAKVLDRIERAIQESDLGVTPSNDGMVIRLPFPELTEERRRELAKQCKGYAEEARVAVRNARRDANAALAKAEKASEITEDDQSRAEKDVQKLTDKYIGKVDDAFKAKEAELMEV